MGFKTIQSAFYLHLQSFNRGYNDRDGKRDWYGDESSREGQIPYPNYRRNMCKALVHRAFKDYYNPINGKLEKDVNSCTR